MRALLFLFLGFGFSAGATCTIQSDIGGVIGPATLDLLNRVQTRVEAEHCSSALFVMNTPGGSLETTHLLVEKILNFPVPVLCLVGPAGAHAGSAGAIILQACHVNGAVSGTNLGAATPIAETGADIPKDLRRKVINDTLSWLGEVVQLRGRNQKFAQDIILQAKSVGAEEALRLNAIDVVPKDVGQFLQFANGRKVQLAGGKSASVEVGDVIQMQLDMRFRTLEVLTDPQFAYLLFLASLALLYFEFTHSGIFLPGVVGTIGLIISLIAFDKLQVEWGGLALIVLGMGLLIAELFVSSFGAFGLGGLTAFVLGSLFLFDPNKTGYRLPLYLILPVAIAFGIAILTLGYLMLRTRRLVKKGGFDELLGGLAEVVRVNGELGRSGFVEIHGETWAFESAGRVQTGDRVRVVGYENLTLRVQPNEGGKNV